jgi:hypothetical protein
MGAKLFASRVLSIAALLGVLALGGYVVYRPTLEGVAVVAIVGLLAFIPSVRAEKHGGSE